MLLARGAPLKLAAFMILVTAPAFAVAQPAADDAGSADATSMTRSEISARLDSDYADLDADKDGKVTSEEISQRLIKSANAKIELLKKERDAAFAKLDSDGNGSISRDEFNERAKLPSVKDPDPKPFLARFDKDGDGMISREEFRAPTLANFEELDRNKDGTLSPDESGETKEAAAAQPASPAKPAAKPAVKKTPPIGR